LAFRQAGYFTAGQALEVGYSHQAQKYHVDRGNWTRVDRGLFRIADWPTGVTDTYARWYVWANGQAVLSHQSAAEIHGFGGFDDGPVHLTLPHSSQARPVGAVLHVGELAEADVKDCGAYRATSVLRTLVDLADSGVPQNRLTVAVGDALEGLKITHQSLRVAAELRSAAAALRVERALAELAEGQ
jgi:predicted transcriptional regulator of viral defense system